MALSRSADWEAAVARHDVDVVVVATTNDALAPVTQAARRRRQARAGREARGAQPSPSSTAADRGRAPAAAARARRLQPSLPSGAAEGPRDRGRRRARPADVRARPLRARRPRRLRQASGAPIPARSGGGELIDQGVHLIDLVALVPRRLRDRRRIRGHLLLGHAGRRQRVPPAANGAGQAAPSCTRAAREWKNLFSFEIYGRDGQARDRRPRRKLRRRAAHALQDAAGNGTARDHDLGVSARRPILGDRMRGVHGRHPARSRADGRPGRGPRRAGPSSKRSTRDRVHSPSAGALRHDHHPQPAADHARRRRHRSAVRTTASTAASWSPPRSTSTSTSR